MVRVGLMLGLGVRFSLVLGSGLGFRVRVD